MIVIEDFDKKNDVKLIRISNEFLSFSALNYGCILHSLNVPDKTGIVKNIVLNYDDFDSYVKNPAYYGAIVGRVANRIRDAKFLLDGKTYFLDKNEGKNYLHGGFDSYSDKFYDFQFFENKEKDEKGVRFFRVSPDGEQGFPGNLQICITYKICKNVFFIDIEAVSDKKTPVNIINHAYFNLSGKGFLENSIKNTEIYLDFEKYLQMKNQIPTGKFLDTAGTSADFSEFTNLLCAIKNNDGIFDHCFFRETDSIEKKVAEVFDCETGIRMQLFTNQKALQFYTPDKFNSFCLETQAAVDAVNNSNFPGIFIEKEKVFKSYTKFCFFH
ncbi:MAG: aldose epimerase family protein [Treponemataceae bacterium]